MLRVWSDTSQFSVCLEPHSPRAVEWIRRVVLPLGGWWGTFEGARSCWLMTAAMPVDLLCSSRLDLLFGPPNWDGIAVPTAQYH